MREFNRQDFLVGSLMSLLAAMASNALATDPSRMPPHPRFRLTNAELDVLRARIANDSDASQVFAALRAAANEVLTQPPITYKIVNEQMLRQSRTCMNRVYLLALLWRMDGRREYFDRAVTEMRAACMLPDWHPAHFLDTAEMMHALSIGYDWLYQDLSSGDRLLVREAIIQKGLEPAVRCYNGDPTGWWTKVNSNWNIVCNGAVVAAAFAVIEDYREPGLKLIGLAMANLPQSIASYAPDGAWSEGLGYWAYATCYLAVLFDGLKSAGDASEFLAIKPGVAQTGDFHMNAVGPCGIFNFADCEPSDKPATVMFWLAERFKKPVYAVAEKRRVLSQKDNLYLIGEHVNLISWPDTKTRAPDIALPVIRVYSGTNIGFIRSPENDVAALFIGAKGGDNGANHSHLDLGSFVFDAQGVRWALDLGPDDYSLPEYFGKKRYTYYRLKTAAHNTIEFDGENQDLRGRGVLKNVDGALEIELSGAYSKKLTKWLRRMKIAAAGIFTVEDEIVAVSPVIALWGMVTSANINLKGREAILTQGSKTLIAEIISPDGAVFDVQSTQAPAPQRSNVGTAKLVVRLPKPITSTTIAVQLRAIG